MTYICKLIMFCQPIGNFEWGMTRPSSCNTPTSGWILSVETWLYKWAVRLNWYILTLLSHYLLKVSSIYKCLNRSAVENVKLFCRTVFSSFLRVTYMIETKGGKIVGLNGHDMSYHWNSMEWHVVASYFELVWLRTELPLNLRKYGEL